LALDALAILVTYARFPPEELYHVSDGGLAGGLSRVLVDLNFPAALVAIAITGVLLERGAPRAAGVAAIALCAVTAVPGVVDQGDLDARLVNVVPALGLAIAAALTVAARPVPRFAPWNRWDPARVALGSLVVAAGVVWIFAELGFYAGSPFFAEAIPPGATEHAVHLGHHHGFDGVLFFFCALLFSRVARSAVLRFYIALMAVYGFVNALQDFWFEQFVKRGWLERGLPSALEPRLSVIWAVMLLATVVLWRIAPRPD
jgi:hypothetical protein